jgi:hypothetical protein
MTFISEELDSDELTEDLRRLQPAWHGTRRWFADKGTVRLPCTRS